MIQHYHIFWTLLLTTFGFALWRGREDERIAASVCLLATLVTQFILRTVEQRYSNLQLSMLLIDIFVLGAFVWIALRSDRFWPLWVAGLQLTVAMAHFMKAIHMDLIPRAYAVAAVVWSYPILLIIIIACWRGQRRTLATIRSTPI